MEADLTWDRAREGQIPCLLWGSLSPPCFVYFPQKVCFFTQKALNPEQAHLDVRLLHGGGLEVGPGLGGPLPHGPPHGPQNAAQLEVVLCQLAVRHPAALLAGRHQGLLQVQLGSLHSFCSGLGTA